MLFLRTFLCSPPRSDVAAVVMEEAAPVAVSAASMRLPGEVYKPSEGGAPRAEAELNK